MNLSDLQAEVSAELRDGIHEAKLRAIYLGSRWRPEPGDTTNSRYARYCNFVIECPDTLLSFYYWKLLVKARLRDETLQAP